MEQRPELNPAEVGGEGEAKIEHEGRAEGLEHAIQVARVLQAEYSQEWQKKDLPEDQRVARSAQIQAIQQLVGRLQDELSHAKSKDSGDLVLKEGELQPSDVDKMPDAEREEYSRNHPDSYPNS